jgi:uncharacterized membrane protein
MTTEAVKHTQHIVQRAVRTLPLWAAYDLVVVSVAATLLPLLLILPFPIIRLPFGLAMAFVAPGYALVAALFPHRDDMGGVARAALSFGLSAAVLPLLALVIDALPWGLRPMPITISLACFVVVASLVGIARRALLRPAEAALPPAIAPRPWWGKLSRSARLAYLGGALAFALVLGAGAYALLAPDPAGQLTEFYALGNGGLAEDYPREVAPGEAMQLTVGISNHEGVAARYRVEARSAQTLLAQAGPITLLDGASWQAPVRYTLSTAGNDQQVDLLLFRDDATTPYRTLHLRVNVVANAGG